VITVGSIHGGETDNVIPDKVDLTATIRYLEPGVQEALHAEIERALSVARSLGGDYEHRIVIGFPPMHNDADVASLIGAVATDLLGEEHLAPPEKSMGAEDFAFFSQLAPGAMFFLGCRIEDEPRFAHNSRFDIDERCLPIGSAMLAESALRLLRGER